MNNPTPNPTPDEELHPLELAHLASYDAADSANYDEAGDADNAIGFDPALALIGIVAVGILALSNTAPEARYMVLWSLLGAVGVYVSFADEIEMLRPTLRDLSIGLVFGALVGLPIIAVGGAQLGQIALATFNGTSSSTSDAAAFSYLVFVMPLAETFFFRGGLHNARGLLFSGLASGAWSIFLFFPALSIGGYPFVAGVLALFFFAVGLLYGYLRNRNGIFTAWTCQIAVNVLVLFATRFIR